MKYFNSIIIVWLIYCTSLRAENKKTSETYNSVQTFTIRYSYVSDGKTLTDKVNLDFAGNYTTNQKKPYVLKITKPDKEKKDAKDADNSENENKLEFESPVNYQEFLAGINERVTTILKEDGKDTISVIADDIAKVYLWFIGGSTKFVEDNVSGTLHLNTFLKIYKDLEEYKDDKTKVNDINAKYNKTMSEKELDRKVKVNELFNKSFKKEVEIDDESQRKKRKKFETDSLSKLLKASKSSEEFIGKFKLIENPLKKISDADLKKETDLINEIINIQKSIEDHEKLNVYENLIRVTDVHLQFEGGFIENVAAQLSDSNNKYLYFENNFPLGFSSKYNYDRLDETKLYIRTDMVDKEENSFIVLGQLLPLYNNKLENNRRDYSPADTTFNSLNPSATPAIVLVKDKTINLFDARIYTDIFGLEAKNSNGLVQTEVRRKLNIFTNRYAISHLINVGSFNYLNLNVSFTKIEDKERFLILKNNKVFENNQLISPSYASTLDFIRYEAFAIGAEPNLFLLDVPNGKVTFFIDFGLRYSRVPIQDSVYFIRDNVIERNFNDNSTPAGLITWSFKLRSEIKTDNRFMFDMGFQYNNTTLLSNNEYKAVSSNAKSNTDLFSRDPNSRSNFTFESNVKYKPDSNDRSNRYFLRFRLTWQYGDNNTFFPQIQLGYNYKIKTVKQ
jgi:hypothetical protein